jgi:hypothetical protein
MDDDEIKVLRISIDGKWGLDEFLRLFEEVETLNGLAAFSENISESDGSELRPWPSYALGKPIRVISRWKDEFEAEIYTENYLREMEIRQYTHSAGRIQHMVVLAIQFQSPGFVDLLGAGKVVDKISKFILGITDRYLAKEDRALAREDKKQNILKKKIANAESLLNLASKANFDQEARVRLMRRVLEIDDYVETILIEEKVTSVESITPRRVSGDDAKPRPKSKKRARKKAEPVKLIGPDLRQPEPVPRKRSE